VTPPLLVRGLLRRYGRTTAVDGLDLTVDAGAIVGFLGPNGAGKTTTLRCCSGLLSPDAGRIAIAGVSLASDPLRARARVGFVPDQPFLYERLTAREFVAFVGAIYDVPERTARDRGDELLDRLGMGAAADELVETYSLGMRQKVSIVAALIHDPPLLMLDEPLGGLDPVAARTLKDLLRERARRGLGVLVSTHLLDVAERLCDRIVVLHHGRRLAEGTLDELRVGHEDSTLEEVFLALIREDP